MGIIQNIKTEMPSKKQRAKRTKYQNNQLNKKRDEIEKQKEREDKIKQSEFREQTGFITEDKMKLMDDYSKKFSYEYFGYYKINGLIASGNEKPSVVAKK